MILFVSGSPRAKACASLIEQITQTNTLICTGTAEACALARSEGFQVIVLDQAGIDVGLADAAAISRAAGTAIVLSINSALMSAERIANEIRGTCARLEYERRIALNDARARAHNEVKNEITGLLLAAGLALSAPGLTPFVETKIREIQQLANRMRNHFDVTQRSP